MVLPSRNHNETGKDYAVACAVPCNAKAFPSWQPADRLVADIP